jgi:hypothetical protein
MIIQRKRNLLLLLTICLHTGWLFSQAEKRTISGFVTDSKTGEKINAAIVFDTISKEGTISNEYGFFSLTIPRNSVVLRITSSGFETFYLQLTSEQQTLDIALQPLRDLKEIVVTGNRAIQQSNSSTIELQMDKVEKLPIILGEKDILRVLQLLPGVKSGGEASSGIYVRGGGPDQNLILLDGVPIYNASHLFGFFSTFNSDAISNVTLIKGGFPARYAGRASSVLDMRMKEGNMKNYNVEGSIGVIASRLLVEGPIKKDKTSFIISARRTYIDALFRPFLVAMENVDAGYFFHDFNAKIQHKINDKHHIYLSGYFGLDKLFVKDKPQIYYDMDGNEYKDVSKSALQWGNSIAALRWNFKISPKLFLNTTGTFSKYHFNVGMEESSDVTTPAGITENSFYSFGYKSGIRDWAIKSDFNFIPNPYHTIRFGISEIQHRFTPGITYLTVEDNFQNQSSENGSMEQNSHELGVYIEDDFHIFQRFKMNLGFHQSAFYSNQKWYFLPQPRLSGNLMLNEKSSIKIGATRTVQFLHLLSNTGIGLPIDLWVPATDITKPVIADQFGISYYRELPKKMTGSIELYYKNMENLIQYKEGVSFISGTEDWQKRITTGRGWAYGAEFFLEKKSGRFTGWIGYTLSWSERQFDELNGGDKFFYRYDRRHDLSIVGTYDINDKWDIGFVFVYGTGNAMTLGTQVYSSQPGMFSYYFQPDISNFEQLNDYRMPAYHRLDFGANYKRQRKKGSSILSLSIYNVYNRQNPFMIMQGYNDNGNPALIQTSLFPIIPSISWKFTFDFEKIKSLKNDQNE